MTADAGVPREHRPYRPEPGPRVRWADGFGQRFTIFVDVEEEFDWRAPLDAAHRSTAAMAAFPAAHARFAARGVGLTCMVDHPIATDPAAVAILGEVLADGRSAIGAQLHPWVNPPEGPPVTPFTSHAGNLPQAMEAAKIAALTDAIAAAFGVRPLAFRAGRYGMGPNTLGLLAAAGYRLDSSVRARFDYRGDGGPDYRACGNAAWRAGALIELPLTTVFTGAARRGGAVLYPGLERVPHGRGLAARTGLLNRVPLTPEGVPVGEALRAIERAVADGEQLLVFSFHSPSLAPGHTPYVRDAADLAAFHRWWTLVLDRLATLGVRDASLAEVLAAAGSKE